MKHLQFGKKNILCGAVLLFLVACGSPEERAAEHYENAVALIASGEDEKASLELRNALREKPDLLEARLAFAQLLERQSDLRGAIGQYGLLVQNVPDSVEAYSALTRLSVEVQDFTGAEVYADRAFELAPDAPDVRAFKATVDFRRGDRAGAVEMARGVIAETPQSTPAHLVLIADRMAAGDMTGAREATETALSLAPEDEDLNLARLAILESMQDTAGVGAQLERMNELFPGRADLETALLQWRIGQGDRAGALQMLEVIAARDPANPDGYLNIAQFYLELDGAEAARAELQRQIETQADPRPYLRALAQLDFAEGRAEAAIASLRTLTEGVETSPEVRELQTMLARMLAQTGDIAGSRELVDAVLAADDRDVDALKLRAAALVEADQTERALQDLRTALLAAPTDPEIMTLMAMAHDREGAPELVGERLARAVEASNLGVPESLRYARFLMQEDRLAPAEGVMLDALRRNPENLDLLLTLGQIHVGRQDWTRARQVVALIRDLPIPQAEEVATGLEIMALQGEGRTQETIALLESFASRSADNIRVRVGLIQALLSEGDIAGAEAEIDALSAEDEAAPVGRMLRAGLLVLKGDPASAEAEYKGLIADQPALEEPYQAMIALLTEQDRANEARALLDQGIDATARGDNLLNIKAGLLYQDGDIEGAISLYDELYRRDTANVILANNLASLISAHRDDAESLERAYQVARRLRGTDVPQFQDTYGWILARRGDNLQALTYLEPAAAAMADDPLVQYHLGMAYLALERWSDARRVFDTAITLAGEETRLPQIAAAKGLLPEIDAKLVEPADTENPGQDG